MEHCNKCLHREICLSFRNNICSTCKNRHQEFVMNENGTCHFFEDKAQFIKVPLVRVGDYLWTDIGSDGDVIIDKVKVTSVCETEKGYDICLNGYRITEEDIGDEFFRCEEEANKYFYNK